MLAFRGFRLIRIIKLSKQWKKLQKLINTIGKSLKDISSFLVLLFLLIFVYILLGMVLFSRHNSDVGAMVIEEPRNNFDNFFNAFLMVFSVLSLELWDQNMFKYARLYGYNAIIYFYSLIIVGVLIFLNLFLAILLENFDTGKHYL